MADCNENCDDDCTFDCGEDKQKGVCLIKEEFVIEDRVRPSNEEDPSVNINQKKSDNSIDFTEDASISNEPAFKKIKLEDKKERLRGQNKARPPPFKVSRELNICRFIAEQVIDEPEKKCENKLCKFLHDREKYLQIKPKDIGTECHLFNLTGRCPRGVACRMGSKHISKEGFNIIDVDKLMEFKKKPFSTRNQLSKDLQNMLRKHKYDFSKAEKIVKVNNPSKKKLHVENIKPDTIKKELDPNDVIKKEDQKEVTDLNYKTILNEHVTHSYNKDTDNEMVQSMNKTTATEEKKIGFIEDYNLIKIRSSEKKRIEWSNKILLSPLTTVGNLPFRRICKEYGADITCGEMALAPKILKAAPEEWALVKRHEVEDIFGVQLCGNNPEVLTRCAQLLNEKIHVDFIDLNLGCPIDLIYRQGGGSSMLNRLNVLETVVKSVSQVVDIPLTIKTRTGVYIDKPVAHNLMPKFRDWGASMITVHGRSREQRYTKLADWKYIEKCAQAAHPIPVFGNGDILSFDDYQRVRNTSSSVQGITIGRGALIKPWIFTEIKEKKLIDISSSERFEILKKYTNYGLEHWGSDTRGVETTRRFMLEWISFLHRYVPVGILEKPPQRINERPPFYRGRNDMETLLASSNCADWVKISEMLLGKVPDGFHFLPKHKANAWK